MNRTQVYKLIDGERDYQDSRWGATLSSDRVPVPQQSNGGDRSIDEFILYIKGYADDAVQVAAHFGDPNAKLDPVRKIAALCVACMEQHGAPERERRGPFASTNDAATEAKS